MPFVQSIRSMIGSVGSLRPLRNPQATRGMGNGTVTRTIVRSPVTGQRRILGGISIPFLVAGLAGYSMILVYGDD